MLRRCTVACDYVDGSVPFRSAMYWKLALAIFRLTDSQCLPSSAREKVRQIKSNSSITAGAQLAHDGC